jgi:hypothetical protein
MNFNFFQSPTKNLQDKRVKHLLASIYEYPNNINDGLEFLDDAIRTKDQPLMYNQKSTARRTPALVYSNENS